MKQRFLGWLFRWRAQRRLAIYRQGWDWAAGELLMGTAPDAVEAQVDNGSFFDDTASDVRCFDEGARAALRAWPPAAKEADRAPGP